MEIWHFWSGPELSVMLLHRKFVPPVYEIRQEVQVLVGEHRMRNVYCKAACEGKIGVHSCPLNVFVFEIMKSCL
jgi:hypothetical protein